MSRKDSSKNVRDYKEHYAFLVESLFESMEASNKGSIQKRLLRALIMQGIPMQKYLRLCCSKNSYANLSNGHNKAQALNDIKLFMSRTDNIVPKKLRRKQFKNEETMYWSNQFSYIEAEFRLITAKLKKTSHKCHHRNSNRKTLEIWQKIFKHSLWDLKIFFFKYPK